MHTRDLHVSQEMTFAGARIETKKKIQEKN